MDEKTRIARGAFAAPVLADMDKDGKLEIIQAAFDGNIYVFHGDGTPSPAGRWPSTTPASSAGRARHRTASSRRRRSATSTATASPTCWSARTSGSANGGQAGAIYLIDGRGNEGARR